MTHYIATSNVARMLAGYEDAAMAGFLERLDPVNAVADASPGFIWRYESGDEESEEVRVFGDKQILFNMSVWESIEALEKFAYQSVHLEVLQKKSNWFERPTRTPLVLWWVKAGHVPSVVEAKERFDVLWRDGPTPIAFTFKERFPAPQE